MMKGDDGEEAWGGEKGWHETFIDEPKPMIVHDALTMPQPASMVPR